ncbi:hypothetical protein ACXFAU_04770 [Paenibacillus glucanolyticus]
MNFAELTALNLIADTELPVEIRSIRDINGRLCINDKVPIPIAEASALYDKGEVVNLSDENGINLGLIYFCSYKRNFLIENLTEWEFIAYLSEVDVDSFLHENYMYKYDYVIIEEQFYSDYLSKYYETSALWGGFVHIEQSTSSSFTKKITEVTAIDNISLPTNYHKDSVTRAIKEPFAFERFLKKYHLIELLFDYDFVENIRNLGTDLKGIGQLLSDYNSKEINRLKSVVSNRVTDVSKISNALNRIDGYMRQAETVFYDYGKESNPIKDIDKFKDIMALGGFTFDNVRSHIGSVNTTAKYEELIINVACYWIYRIRCCSAHNKIGEYIFDSNDEEFVAVLGEGLIDKIVQQLFKV